MSRSRVSGTLRGKFGDVAFDEPVTVDAGAAPQTVKHVLHLRIRSCGGRTATAIRTFTPSSSSSKPRSDAVSDTKTFQAGVRQFTYSEEGGALRIWINGRRFIPRGGNWGFSESMLRYRAREYDAAVRYHRDMNFTMIRNWVGQIGEDAFYEACDRHGIVVWQDFWLANPYDGPDPDDNDLFLRNVQDTVLRIRSHPSIGLYCGRNEGQPPPALEPACGRCWRNCIRGCTTSPVRRTIPSAGTVPIARMPLKFYFTQRATPKLHSELGMPNIVSMDSLRADDAGGEHVAAGPHVGSARFLAERRARRRIVPRTDREELRRRGERGGVGAAGAVRQLRRLSRHVRSAEQEPHGPADLDEPPDWPSFVWQTYDYYLDPTAGYFGAKKASEPLHIQWNPVTDNVEVVNYSAGDAPGLTRPSRSSIWMGR